MRESTSCFEGRFSRRFPGTAGNYRSFRAWTLAIALGLVPSPGAAGADDFAARRSGLVDSLRREWAGLAQRVPAVGVPEERVLAALAKVPRHELVPDGQRDEAYEDRPLPIGEGQTISQPFIVALMTALAAPDPGDVVLEVGTGSGYQAAVLAELADTVYTIEIVAPLGRRAASDLARLEYRNIVTRIGDGYAGWPEHAPFDAIVVTAAAPEVPQPLIDQLKPVTGRLVVPVDAVGGQELLVLSKDANGAVERRMIIPVRFVPLTGKARDGRR
ncbi:MAG: protein-L-isoaspartate(D-aspartate) O-methyltransferase [Candidatus Binatia bacterium]